MAKKTSKQGNKANKSSEKKTVDTSQKTAAVTSEAPKKTEKPAKVDKSAKEQKKASKPAKSAPKKDGIFKKIATYVKNVRLEIKRTTWPSRNEVFRMSLIVVGALLFFGVFIFVMDWVMTWLLELYAGLVPAADPSLVPTDPSAIDPSAVDPSAVDPSAVDPSATPDASTPDATTPDASEAPSSEEAEQ
jgi:preprotein translocase subunit SecE